MRRIRIYADGSSIVKKRSGGWSFLASCGGEVLVKRSGWFSGTNNEGELRAAIASLEWMSSVQHTPNTVFELYTDSSYVLKHLYSFTLTKTDNLKLLGTMDSETAEFTGILGQNRRPNHYPELWGTLQRLLRDVATTSTVYIWWLRGHLTDRRGGSPTDTSDSLRTHSEYHSTVDRLARQEARHPN